MEDKKFAVKVLNVFADCIEHCVDQIECPNETLPDVVRSHLEACSMGFSLMSEVRQEQVAWMLSMVVVLLAKAQKDGLCLRHEYPNELRTSVATKVCENIALIDWQ